MKKLYIKILQFLISKIIKLIRRGTFYLWIYSDSGRGLFIDNKKITDDHKWNKVEIKF